MKPNDIQFKSFENIKDKYLGEIGTVERDQYEFELRLDILGEIIKQTRKERNLTQEQLGKLVGVKKSEISKLERNARNMTIGTVLKVFRAMRANVKFMVKLDDNELIVT
ncbi:MAG: helix-turn-helix transcriptional regulator [Bacteroidales bacterium]|nr:helix-turn-helix transcriptional regulator [Bacteroidales bacterium]